MGLAMNFNYLLTEDDRYKYYILQYLELNKKNYLSVESVCEFAGLSKFKVKKYLGELNNDLQTLQLTNAVQLLDNNEITVQSLTTMVVKRTRLAYLQKSGIYRLLQNALTDGLGVEAFAKQNFLSKSYVYLLKKQLSKILKEYHIEYRNNVLRGSELAIRDLLYTIYYDFYNGLGQPFSAQIEAQIEQLKQQISRYYPLKLSLIKNVKLNLFLGVLIQRLKQNYSIDADTFTIVDEQNDTFSMSQIINGHKVEIVDIQERDWLLTFLYAENMTSCYLGRSVVQRVKTIENGTQAICQTIMAELALPITVEKNLYHQLLTTNLRFALFYVEASTFTSKRQIRFFEESYPTGSAVVANHLETFMTQATINPRLQISLFYSYLFAIIESVPYQMLNPSIYVCVDFSNGEAYTHYIEKQIMGFKNLNIVLEENVTQRTQLYVSDFAQEVLKIDQIIWKNPPSTDDWGDFGDLIVKIKKELVLDETTH